MSLARVRALIVVGLLVLTAAVVITWAIVRDSRPSTAGTQRDCDKGEIPVETTLPEAKDVKVNVYNAGDERGLAGRIAGELKQRKYQVPKVASVQKAVSGVAEIIYGPKGLGAAHMVQVQVAGAEMIFDRARTDDVVDLVLGAKFKELRTDSEVKLAISQVAPSLPPGTC